MLRGPFELPLGLKSADPSMASSSPSPEAKSGEDELGFGILLPLCCFRNRSSAGLLTAALVFGGAVPTLLLRILFAAGLLRDVGLRALELMNPLGERSGGLGLGAPLMSASKLAKLSILLSKLTLLTLMGFTSCGDVSSKTIGKVMLSFSSLKLTVLPLSLGGGVFSALFIKLAVRLWLSGGEIRLLRALKVEPEG